MRLAALVCIALLATAASAADFRTLDFGARCEQLTGLEAARGSSAYTGPVLSGYGSAFKGQYLNRDVTIGYDCPGGVFFRGAYIFAARDAADASALYGKLKARLTHDLGAPAYDFASREYRNKMKAVGATLSRSDTEVAFWNAGRSEVHLSVAEASGIKPWRVSLSYTDLSKPQARH